jgi:D-glycero-beta-D-manno-heptose 1-phosphate adenylyltransferase
MAVLDATSLPIILSKLRAKGKRVVLTQGSFDMVHIGHGRYLEQAKSYGDILIVGVDSDAKIKHRKGDDRPIVPQDERLEMLTYLKSVDYVYLKELDAPKYSLIKAVNPDVLVATRDTYTPQKIATLKKYCGRIEVLEPMATTSTSAKIRLLQMGAAQKISDTLSSKLISTIEDVLAELKGEKK